MHLAVTPLRDMPLAEQLAIHGGLRRMPRPRRRAGRLRAALPWAALLGGLVFSVLAF